jgi:hypothetical protein
VGGVRVNRVARALFGFLTGIALVVAGVVLVFVLAAVVGGLVIVGGVAVSAVFLLAYDIDPPRGAES